MPQAMELSLAKPMIRARLPVNKPIVITPLLQKHADICTLPGTHGAHLVCG